MNFKLLYKYILSSYFIRTYTYYSYIKIIFEIVNYSSDHSIKKNTDQIYVMNYILLMIIDSEFLLCQYFIL